MLGIAEKRHTESPYNVSARPVRDENTTQRVVNAAETHSMGSGGFKEFGVLKRVAVFVRLGKEAIFP